MAKEKESFSDSTRATEGYSTTLTVQKLLERELLSTHFLLCWEEPSGRPPGPQPSPPLESGSRGRQTFFLS